MRRFELKDDQAYKFWQIELTGTSFTVKFGRIATKGQEQTKSFASAAEAKAAHDQLIAEKLKKGYVETTKSKAAPASPREALEVAILANPDDLAAHAAYADWLLEQGDPRGEFIQVQLALEDEGTSSAARKKLRKREEELLKSHRQAWVGPWEPLLLKDDKREIQHRQHWNHDLPGPVPCQFLRGCLAQISVNRLNVACAREIVRCPQTRFVWRLAIGRAAWDSEDEYEPGSDAPADSACAALHVLLGWPVLANLRFFQLGHEPKEGHFNSHTGSDLAYELVEKMPRLQELQLFASRLPTSDLFRLRSLQHLRVLRVYHSYHCDLERLARNPALRQLTHLLLHPHAREPGDDWYIRLAGVQALVKSQQLRNLTHLQLRSSDLGDRGCAALVQSGILKRLRALDLRQGVITDEGARTLAACPDVARLEVLDLKGNKLTDEGIRALRSVNRRLQPASEKGNEGFEFDGDVE